MSDRFYRDIEIPDLTDEVLEPPPAGFIQVFGRNNKLAYSDSNGVETVVGTGGGSTQLLVDGGGASTTFNQFLLRLDFGSGGASINPSGVTTP